MCVCERVCVSVCVCVCVCVCERVCVHGACVHVHVSALTVTHYGNHISMSCTCTQSHDYHMTSYLIHGFRGNLDITTVRFQKTPRPIRIIR